LEDVGWFGLGPVAVLPGRQRRGIGETLIRFGLRQIEEIGGRGCVVLGEPGYYSRFGFESDPKLRFADVPAEYFQRLVFKGDPPTGLVRYHPAFHES
jgi:predicted N-acetyltransferase YhbS